MSQHDPPPGLLGLFREIRQLAIKDHQAAALQDLASTDMAGMLGLLVPLVPIFQLVYPAII